MTGHVAHAASAIVRAVSEAEGEEATSIVFAMIAQAEATLALVEQQRIANLIALATGVDVIGGTGIARLASDEAHRLLVSDPNGELRPEIREVLGLEVIS